MFGWDNKLKNSRGFSLAEVMVAMGLLAVAIIALVGLFAGGLQFMSRSTEVATASGIAREILEQSKAMDFSEIPYEDQVYSGSIPTLPAGLFPPQPYPVKDVGGRKYVATVSTLPKPGTTDILIVTVKVTWDESSNVEVQTFLLP